MDMTAILLLVCFFTLLLINVPISISIALSTFVSTGFAHGFYPSGNDHCAANDRGNRQLCTTGHSVFILSGLIMGQGGIARRLIESAMAMVGFFTGRSSAGQCDVLYDVWRNFWFCSGGHIGDRQLYGARNEKARLQ